MRKLRFVIVVFIAAFTCLAGRANAFPISGGGAIAVLDLETPSNFTFIFTVPTIPLVGVFESVLELSGTLTDGGRDGVSAVPFDTLAIAQALIEDSAVLDLGPASFASGPYGPLTISTIINSADFGGTIDTIGARISFTGSGGNDQYQFTVKHTLQEVAEAPVPTTLALFGLGLVGLGWFGAGQRKKISISP